MKPKVELEIEHILADHIAEMRRTTGKNLTVVRMRPILALLDNPHHKLRVIHVAGTSGKTSTAYYIANLLERRGCRVGLTVSPHIDSITERVQINGQAVSPVYFLRELKAVLSRLQTLQFQPTYFEILIALAFWCFAKEKVDYAVLETGLGGRYDATNIADHPNKVAVITDIGLDHMAILGETVREIAWQKAGIIHPGNQVFMYRQSQDIDAVVDQQIKEVQAGASLHPATPRRIPQMPLFQSRNWVLASQVCDHIAQRDGLGAIPAAALTKSQQIAVPGRLNVVHYRQKRIIIDGAHNQQKMKALVDTLREQYPSQQFHAIVGFKQGKEYQAALQCLVPITEHITTVPVASKGHAYVQSVSPAQIGDYLASQPVTFSVADDLQQAVDELERYHDMQPVLITGSLYLAAQARKIILS